jgi:hypothetical protein
VTQGRNGAGTNPHALFASLAGLVPMLLAVIPFSLSMWTLGLGIYFAATALLIARKLLRREPIESLDAISVLFFIALAVAYASFGDVFLLQHFGAVINALLLGQVIYGEMRGGPWTLQFTKRMYPAELWHDRVFLGTNRLLSRIWGVIFGICIVSAALGTNGWLRAILPTALPIAAIVLSPRFGRWYGQRVHQKAVAQLVQGQRAASAKGFK